MPIVRMNVDSDCFVSIGYDITEWALELTFQSGHTYLLLGVSPVTALDFSNASSKGQFYHSYLRGNYKEVKVR